MIKWLNDLWIQNSQLIEGSQFKMKLPMLKVVELLSIKTKKYQNPSRNVREIKKFKMSDPSLPKNHLSDPSLPKNHLSDPSLPKMKIVKFKGLGALLGPS